MRCSRINTVTLEYLNVGIVGCEKHVDSNICYTMGVEGVEI